MVAYWFTSNSLSTHWHRADSKLLLRKSQHKVPGQGSILALRRQGIALLQHGRFEGLEIIVGRHEASDGQRRLALHGELNMAEAEK